MRDQHPLRTLAEFGVGLVPLLSRVQLDPPQWIVVAGRRAS